MSRLKTKRVVWTIAGLVAIAVIALLLHQPGQPKIIGKISPGDISAISNITLKFRRGQVKERMRLALEARDIVQLVVDTAHFARVRVVSIKAVSSEEFDVTVGTGTNEVTMDFSVTRNGSGWKVSPHFFEM